MPYYGRGGGGGCGCCGLFVQANCSKSCWRGSLADRQVAIELKFRINYGWFCIYRNAIWRGKDICIWLVPALILWLGPLVLCLVEPKDCWIEFKGILMKFFAGSSCQHIKRFGHKTAQDPGYHLAVKLSTPDSLSLSSSSSSSPHAFSALSGFGFDLK